MTCADEAISRPGIRRWARFWTGGGRSWFEILLAAGLFCAVAIINLGPLAYPDSGAYLIDAERLFVGHAPYALRPVLYGAGAELLSFGERWFSFVLFVQALVLAHLLRMVADKVGARRLSLVWVALGLTVLTPISWSVSHLLPDIFVPMLALSLFLLGYGALSLGERIYLTLLASAAAAMHLTALPIGLAVLGTGAAIRILTRRRVALGAMAMPLALAVAGLLTFSVIVWGRPTFTPNSPPHLLARLLADGPARQFLRVTCPGSDFAICAYLDDLPDTEDGFLWEMLPRLPTEDGKLIKEEAGRIVDGTLAMFPTEVASAMVVNSLRQLVTFDVALQPGAASWPNVLREPTSLFDALQTTREAEGGYGTWVLACLNATYAAVACLSLLVGLAAWWRARALGRFLPGALFATVIAAISANAFVCGAFGGVFGRYGGRVIWLLPFAAAVAWQVAISAQRERARVRRPAARPTSSRTSVGAAASGPRRV